MAEEHDVEAERALARLFEVARADAATPVEFSRVERRLPITAKRSYPRSVAARLANLLRTFFSRD